MQAVGRWALHRILQEVLFLSWVEELWLARANPLRGRVDIPG